MSNTNNKVGWEDLNTPQQRVIEALQLTNAAAALKRKVSGNRRRRDQERKRLARQNEPVRFFVKGFFYEEIKKVLNKTSSGVKKLDKSFKMLFGMDCPAGWFPRISPTITADIFMARKEHQIEEIKDEFPLSRVVLGYAAVKAEVQKLVDKYVGPEKAYKGFKLYRSKGYRPMDSRGAFKRFSGIDDRQWKRR